MKKSLLLFNFLMCSFFAFAQSYSLKSALSYPFPSELTATNQKIAWAVNEQGKRNIYVAEAPTFKAKKITNFNVDDGQELTSISVSTDGKYVVFVRGGDHASRDRGPVNPASNPFAPKVEIFSVPFDGGDVKILAEGDAPLISPNSNQIIYSKNGQVFICAIDGSDKATNLFYARGNVSNYKWSPDGKKLLFVAHRSDHAYIGIFTDNKTPIQWISPGFGIDSSPIWSPDGQSVAFVMQPGSAGVVDSILVQKHQPWSIWVTAVETGKGNQIYKAPQTLRGSFPSVAGGANLNWAGDKIVFLSYEDGWPHLYSMNTNGSNKILLTPGDFSVENISISSNKQKVILSANTGTDADDIDRKHVYSVSINKADMQQLSKGLGIESYPLMLADNSTVVCLSATAQQPLMPAVITPNKTVKVIGSELIPNDFPLSQMVTPTRVTFKAADGVTVYGQLFEPKNAKGKKPAIVYIHGGPQRQMLLGWSPMDYYSVNYATNQYLVSLGFTVLSVNYRLGIGYGYEFHKPENAGAQGASEYLDIKAAGEWLAKQPGVDAHKIGVYGGSYGGYLTGLALGKDSKLFKAGVNIHGVNNRFNVSYNATAPDFAKATEIAKMSSPIAYVDTWSSPTLIIHGDDDRNVDYSHSINLARKFEDKKIPFEYLAIPDDTHHWMKFSNTVLVSEATAEFLNRYLNKK